VIWWKQGMTFMSSWLQRCFCWTSCGAGD